MPSGREGESEREGEGGSGGDNQWHAVGVRQTDIV